MNNFQKREDIMQEQKIDPDKFDKLEKDIIRELNNKINDGFVVHSILRMG